MGLIRILLESAESFLSSSSSGGPEKNEVAKITLGGYNALIIAISHRIVP